MIERSWLYFAALALPVQEIRILFVGEDDIVLSVDFVMLDGFCDHTFCPLKIPFGDQLSVAVESIHLFIFSGDKEPVFFVLSEFSNRHSV